MFFLELERRHFTCRLQVMFTGLTWQGRGWGEAGRRWRPSRHVVGPCLVRVAAGVGGDHRGGGGGQRGGGPGEGRKRSIQRVVLAWSETSVILGWSHTGVILPWFQTHVVLSWSDASIVLAWFQTNIIMAGFHTSIILAWFQTSIILPSCQTDVVQAWCVNGVEPACSRTRAKGSRTCGREKIKKV